MSTSCNPFVGTSCCRSSCRVLAQILAAVLLDRSCLHIQSYPWLSPIHCCLFQPLHSSHLQWLRYPSSVCRPALFPTLFPIQNSVINYSGCSNICSYTCKLTRSTNFKQQITAKFKLSNSLLSNTQISITGKYIEYSDRLTHHYMWLLLFMFIFYFRFRLKISFLNVFILV